MRHFLRTLVFAFFLLPCIAAFAAGEVSFRTTPGDPFGFHTFKLENGLTVILAKNTDSPKVKIYTLVKVGSVHEQKRSTGLAHYFEHLIFKGSSRIASLDWAKEKPLLDKIEELYEQYRKETDPEKRKAIYAEIDRISGEAAKYSNDEYWLLLQAMGCTGTNAFTSYDITAYESTVPAHMLERYLTLEFERFRDIALRRFHTELETVYEEFNRTQDNDSRQALYAALELVAGKGHPLARPVIGLPEHLKNPSIRDVRLFFEQYYVPENMTLILSGDLDYSKAAEIIRKTFGRLPAKKVHEKPAVPALKPLAEPLTAEVIGKESEFLVLAYPLNVVEKENGYIRDLMYSVLSNGMNGIFDVNLRKPQKVQSVSCSIWTIAGQNILFIEAAPLKGQTLEELRALIEHELDNLKNGKFDPTILTAVVNNNRLQLMKMAENFEKTASVALELSRQNISMQDVLDDLKKTEKLTKESFVRQVRQIFRSAPAVVYKRTGEPKDRVHAEKPPITPVPIPDQLSAFARDLLRIPAAQERDLEVIDWSTAIRETPVPGAKLFSTKNEKNERFTFTIVFPIGSYHDLKHDLAISYLTLLGTDEKSLTDFNSDLYNLALDIDIDCSAYTSTVTISGLQKNLPDALRLLAERLNRAKADPEAYKRFVERIKKARIDSKKDSQLIFSAALQYALYGKNNAYARVIPGAELDRIDPVQLTSYLRSLCSAMPHDFVYYGPGTPEETAGLIKKYFPAPAEKMIVIPEPVKFKIVPPAENVVYYVQQPTVQVLTALARTDSIRIPANTAFESLLDGYAGPLFFTELREKQSLGYVAQASYSTPSIQPDNYSTFLTLLGTQPDKLETGMQAMLLLVNQMPENAERFSSVRLNTLTSLRAVRIKPENRYWYRLKLNRLRMPLDWTARDFRTVSETTPEVFFRQAKEAMNRSKNIWVICGNLKDVPSTYGKVIILTPEMLLPE